MNRAQLTAAKDADRYSRIAYLLRMSVLSWQPSGAGSNKRSGR